ncbi:MAG: metallophosphoesterase [Pseudomonadota bacterium]
MITRRAFLRWLAGLTAAGLAGIAYAGAVEPALRLSTVRWSVRPRRWPAGLSLRLAILSDIHIGPPTVTLGRLERVVDRMNALGADLALLLGDYEAGHPFRTASVPMGDVARVLAGLRAPLGTFAVMGNHDWWHDPAVQESGQGPTFVHRAFADAGLTVLENRAIRLEALGGAFWLAGLGDQIALRPGRGGRTAWQGVDDLPGTLVRVTDDAPVILMAHEPDIFPRVPDRVALTLSGHTHGGQVRLFGWSPLVPSRFGNRYAYGHVIEDQRHLVVSGGLGCSIVPLRFGVPPEITVVEIAAPTAA